METPPSDNPVEIPAKIPDEPVSTAVFPAQNSISEKISGALSRTAEKFNLPFRRKGGRPPKAEHELKYPRRRPLQGENPVSHYGGNVENDIPQPGSKTIPVDFPANDKPNEMLAPAPAHSPCSEIFRKACGAAIKGTFGIANAVLRHFCTRANLGLPFTEKLIKEVSPEPEAMADTIEALDAVCKKRGWKPENAEEIALGVNMARLLAPYGSALMMLRAEIAKQSTVRVHSDDLLKKIATLESTVEKLYAEKTAA